MLDDPSDPLTWYGRMAIEDGKEYSAGDFIKAMGARDRMMNQFADVFDDYDLLLSPYDGDNCVPGAGVPARNRRQGECQSQGLELCAVHAPHQYYRASRRKRAMRFLIGRHACRPTHRGA